MMEIARRLGIDWKFKAPYFPTMTGLVERLNRTYLEKLRKVSESGRKDCYGCIGAATKAYMLSSNWTLKCSPSEVNARSLDRKHINKYRDFFAQNAK